MDNLTGTVGKNIRELRLGKQMTQAELAGGEITRNMLSLIENGQAAPSVATLVYLAEKLEVPVGYFFSESEAEMSAIVKTEMIEKIRRLYANKEYEKCVDLCRATSTIDDEIAYIVAMCELTLAYESCKKFHLTTAEEHLENALAASELTTYNQLGFSQAVDFIERMIKASTADEIDSALTQPFRYSNAGIPAELFIFLHRLKAIEDGTSASADLDSLMQSPIYRDYISAKAFIKNDDPVSAIPLLRKIVQNPDTGFFVMYRACTDLENCSNSLEDYKSAYAYSKKKMELIEKFKK